MTNVPSFEKRKERAEWRQNLNEILIKNEKERFQKEVKAIHEASVASLRAAEEAHYDNVKGLQQEIETLNEDIKMYNLLSKVRDGKLELRFTDTGKRCKILFV